MLRPETIKVQKKNREKLSKIVLHNNFLYMICKPIEQKQKQTSELHRIF